MTPTSAPLAAARDLLLGALSRSDLLALSDARLLDAIEDVESIGRVVDSLRVAVAAEADARSSREAGAAGLSFRLGHRTGAQLLERLTRAPAAEIARRLELGAATRPQVALATGVRAARRPVLAEALERGELDKDAALTIERALTQAERSHPSFEALDAAEAELVGAARESSADIVRVEARVWRDYLDPDGVEPREERIRERRGLVLGRERNGLTPISGHLDPSAASLLRAAFAEALSPDATPRFLDEDDRVAAEVELPDGGVVVDRARDPRTRQQRQHDVFVGLLTAGVRSTGNAPGELRPLTTVLATITLDELLSGRGLGRIDQVDEPVAASTIQQLVCDSGIRLSILDANGVPLDEGRRVRLFTAAQRRALALRDGGCAWPGCTAPPGWCEAHHIVPWSRGGPSDLANGVLLCPAHHRMIHQTAFEIRMVAGRPQLVAPAGLDRGRAPYRRPRLSRSWGGTYKPVAPRLLAPVSSRQ